ncbi:MAG: hypothetical protein KBT29_09745 [Prevotellaceae bacterium]|nr:hypothetical protein [Candidatus Minthosoma caballi]
MAVAAQPQMLDITISIPKVDFKRLKGLIKVMGWEFRKAEEPARAELPEDLIARIDQARKEIREGKCVVCNTPDEIDAYFASL